MQLSQLDAQLRGYEKGTTRQIAIAVFRSLDGESLEDVSIRLAEKWKIGGKTSNDGVLVTLFLDDQKLRIEVGYGLEGSLTDAKCARIIREVMGPRLGNNDLYGALSAGAAAIDTTVTGRKHAEGEPPPAAAPTPGGNLPVGVIFLVVIVILVVVGSAISGRGSLLFTILNIFLSSGGGWSGGGGGWSSGGRGGGGGGGWSGGGGSFGGGGASGSW